MSSVDIAPDAQLVFVDDDDISMIASGEELNKCNERNKHDCTMARVELEDEIQETLGEIITEVVC